MVPLDDASPPPDDPIPAGILDAARAIRPCLAELLPFAPESAARIDDELARLLARSTEPDTADRVRGVLEGNPVTEVWLSQFLEFGVPPDFLAPGTRGTTSPGPAGDGETVRPGPKFVCPVGGDVVWWRRHVGQDVPRCATHGVILVKV
ncbi:hypothetical protein ABB07_04665 [Streptomyces incarnatus]|uniref:Uncharacterized protein n=1 Tax=Streptomyces incarnatus TaxID=665007 RepID=A0ABM5TEC5_9ACTN|nr:hypothetical protein ABB07_04665 [Streptomyces incarnatus]